MKESTLALRPLGAGHSHGIEANIEALDENLPGARCRAGDGVDHGVRLVRPRDRDTGLCRHDSCRERKAIWDIGGLDAEKLGVVAIDKELCSL